MTAVPQGIDPAQFLHEHLTQAPPDLMRQMLITFINALLSAEADAVCGAAYNARSDERVTSRNGYRHRDLDNRTGTIDVAIPKLRSGTYSPEWLLEPPPRRSGTDLGGGNLLPAGSVDPADGQAGPVVRGSLACRSRRCR